MRAVRLVMVVVMVLSFARVGRAQQEPKIGLVMGYPAQVGVLWNASDRIALRPEFGFTHDSNDSTSLTTQS
ncbi:MAG TPA: hypothetical protein VFA59_05460, partial [Vicinamibacterales bacterium]|nr:hypothetical protein [Vicinamibacterales bacterium]